MDLSKVDNIGDAVLMALVEGQGDVVKDVYELFSSFLALFGVLLTISVALFGLAIMIMNQSKETVYDMIKVIFLSITATTFVLTEGYEWFFGLAMEIRIKVSIFLLPRDGGTIFSSTKDTFESLYALGEATYDNGSWMGDSMPKVIGLVTLATCSIYYLCMLANLLLSEFFLLILYLLGSFIVVLSCFKSSRQLLKTWIISVFKYSLAFIISGLIISVIDNALRPTLYEAIMISNDPNGNSDEYSILLGIALALSVFGSYLMKKAIELSVELTGGVMSDGNAGVQSMANAASTSWNTGKTAAKGGWKVYKALSKGSS